MKSTRFDYWIVLVTLLFSIHVGCSNGVNERVIEVKPQPPTIERVRTLLERYVDGLPVGSEIEQFPVFISDLRDSDGDNLPIVEALFKALQENPDKSAELAKEALEKLAIKETGS